MKNKKPETPAEWALERASLSCRIGVEAIDLDAKLHALIRAVENIVEYLKIKEESENAKH